MTLVHCPEGERLFLLLQYEEAWDEYRAHRAICKECGMKDD